MPSPETTCRITRVLNGRGYSPGGFRSPSTSIRYEATFCFFFSRIASTSIALHAAAAAKNASRGVGPRLSPPKSGCESMTKRLPLGGSASKAIPPIQLTVTMYLILRGGGSHDYRRFPVHSVTWRIDVSSKGQGWIGMKNQNDLIFSIVGFVVLLIVVGVCIGTRPEPPVPPKPQPVNTADPKFPTGVAPVMANGLPSGGSSSGGGGAAVGRAGGGSGGSTGKPKIGQANMGG